MMKIININDGNGGHEAHEASNMRRMPAAFSKLQEMCHARELLRTSGSEKGKMNRAL
ncbi:MAG TPA: hypothetical protein VEC35_16070 [Noviherbaspirillum sp.]|nr:hypothetical protein [Noviherbaspirillum sp.]